MWEMAAARISLSGTVILKIVASRHITNASENSGMQQINIRRQMSVLTACFAGLLSHAAVADVILTQRNATQRDSQLGAACEFGYFGGVTAVSDPRYGQAAVRCAG